MAWAFFDFDDTLVRGDSILHWNRFLFKRHPKLRLYGPILWAGMILLALRLIDKMTFKRLLLLPSGCLSEDERTQCVEDFSRSVLPSLFYEDMLLRLKRLRNEGFSIGVLTASAGFYLKGLPSLVPLDLFKSTPMSFPKKSGGWWNPPLFQELNFKGPRKVEYLVEEMKFPTKGIGFLSFSDHHSDRFLLEYTEYPTAVNPNKKLTQIARQNKWPIFIPQKARAKHKLQFEKIRLFIAGWL